MVCVRCVNNLCQAFLLLFINQTRFDSHIFPPRLMNEIQDEFGSKVLSNSVLFLFVCGTFYFCLFQPNTMSFFLFHERKITTM